MKRRRTEAPIRFYAVIESVRLAAWTGESLPSRVGSLRMLLQETGLEAPGGTIDHCLVVEGYLALAEVAARSRSMADVLEALVGADRTLDVLLRARRNALG